MRVVMIALLSVFSILAHAQTESTLLDLIHKKQHKYNWKERILPATSFYVAGFSDGVSQMLQFHYGDFKRLFPNSSDQFWDPRISWQNKNNAWFPFSRTALVMFTDGYHLTRGGETVFTTLGLVITPYDIKQPWWHYVLDLLIYSAVKMVGFHTSYTILPRLIK